MSFTEEVLKQLSLDPYKDFITEIKINYSFERKGYRNLATVDQEGVSPYFKNETRLAVTVEFDQGDKVFYNSEPHQLVRGSLLIEFDLTSLAGQSLLALEKKRLKSEINEGPINRLKQLTQEEKFLEARELLDKIIEGKV